MRKEFSTEEKITYYKNKAQYVLNVINHMQSMSLNTYEFAFERELLSSLHKEVNFYSKRIEQLDAKLLRTQIAKATQ